MSIWIKSPETGIKREFAIGKVVRLIEHNGYNDSDFIAVYQDEDGSFKRYVYQTTRACVHGNAFIDATEDVIASYKKHIDEIRIRNLNIYDQADFENSEGIYEPRKGEKVEIIKGRKIKIGTILNCFWIGQTQYGMRIGLTDDSGKKYWTNAKNARRIIERPKFDLKYLGVSFGPDRYQLSE